MSLYSYNHYIDVLKAAFNEKKCSERPDLKWGDVASAIRVQAPYLSKVLTGRAHLSADQVFLASRFFEFNEDVEVFFTLLVEKERSALAEKKQQLESEINKIRQTKLAISENTQAPKVVPAIEDLSHYFLDSIAPLVHMFLTIDSYRNHHDEIAKRLRVPMTRVKKVCKELEKMGAITTKDGQTFVIKDSLHLDRDSPLSKVQQVFSRLRAIEHLQNQVREQDYHFSVTFSSNEEIRNQIRELFLNFLNEVESLVRESDPKDVYQLHFDLFSWSR